MVDYLINRVKETILTLLFGSEEKFEFTGSTTPRHG